MTRRTKFDDDLVVGFVVVAIIFGLFSKVFGVHEDNTTYAYITSRPTYYLSYTPKPTSNKSVNNSFSTINTATTKPAPPTVTPLPSPTLDASRYSTLNIGDYGDDVLNIKNRLSELKYFGYGSFSKEYTESTAKGIQRFQKDNGLPETGIADPITQAMLFGDSLAVKANNADKFSSNANQTQKTTTQSENTSSSFSYASPYIGNKNTCVFHDRYCGSVKTMKDSNKISFSTRQSAINSGYRPCKKCNP